MLACTHAHTVYSPTLMHPHPSQWVCLSAPAECCPSRTQHTQNGYFLNLSEEAPTEEKKKTSTTLMELFSVGPSPLLCLSSVVQEHVILMDSYIKVTVTIPWCYIIHPLSLLFVWVHKRAVREIHSLGYVKWKKATWSCSPSTLLDSYMMLDTHQYVHWGLTSNLTMHCATKYKVQSTTGKCSKKSI